MSGLPARWRAVTLGDLGVQAQPGFASGKHGGSGEILHLRPMNITPLGHLDATGGKYVSAAAGAQRTQRGDVMFNNTNSLAWVGKTALVSTDAELAFSNHMTRLRVGDALDPVYLAHHLHFLQQTGYFSKIANNHVNQSSVATGRLLQVEIPVPPLDEQHRIVAILEDHLSRLEAATFALASARTRANALVSVIIAQAVADALASGGVSTIGAHARVVEYGTSAKSQERDSGDGVPVLRMGNIQGGSLDWTSLKYLSASHSEFPRLLLESGDLLFNRTNSSDLVGKSAVFTGARVASFASYLIRVRLTETLIPEWANLVINSRYGRDYITRVATQQVGQANVNGTKLRAFPIPVPAVGEQRRLIDQCSEAQESTARLGASIAQAAVRAAGLRRSLLAAAFRGDLTAAA